MWEQSQRTNTKFDREGNVYKITTCHYIIGGW